MERYTEKHYDGNGYYLICSGNCETFNCGDCGILDKIVDRLASYEDTGLEPEDFKRTFTEDAPLKLTGQLLGVTPDRLRELAQADKEDRCFVFSFGLGSIAYRIWVHPSGSPGFVTEHKMSKLKDLINAETWDNAYSTRAEAEAALRREQDG